MITFLIYVLIVAILISAIMYFVPMDARIKYAIWAIFAVIALLYLIKYVLPAV